MNSKIVITPKTLTTVKKKKIPLKITSFLKIDYYFAKVRDLRQGGLNNRNVFSYSYEVRTLQSRSQQI